MSIAPNDAILNGTLVASATRLHRVRKELLSTPSGFRQPEFGSSARRRRQDRSLSPFRALDTFSRRSRNEPPSARSTRSVRFWISCRIWKACSLPGAAVAYAALRAQIRREFEEHMERDNRPVTVMTSAGLVTLSLTEVQGNDAWLCEQPIPGLPERKISQQPHLHDGH
ncbi:hypothetical protein D6C83_05028 [Aureobasidium pullulans]|uniref:Uncharacterized protein n=1 Tax=Aureobasidium pullulans TaxID=5580 RepID=A0A4T0CKD0_AURPU|nr:hypothetical protein D6D12_06952 [Aureobasidium pullulans]THX61735.1 hypothetical protein D6D11_02735 [Aureobasidium pullulans]TIA48421.1 hypothetical protein D6C83_05028 [Aureobasidium pullulans]